MPTIGPADMEDILRVKIETAEDFDRLMNLSRPFIIENLDIGSCTKTWTAEELIKRVSQDRIVLPPDWPELGVIC